MNTPATVQEATIMLRPQGDACAAVTDEGQWLLLTPLNFAPGYDARFLKRWDRVRFVGDAKRTDARPEMRHVAARSMTVVRESKPQEQQHLLEMLTHCSLQIAEAQGLTLALLKPKAAKLHVEKKKTGAATTRNFGYHFLYSYQCDDGEFKTPYRDSEMDAMLDNLSKSYGEAKTVARIMQVYGKEYPGRGMLFVMGRESPREPWIICGVVVTDEAVGGVDLSSLDLVC